MLKGTPKVICIMLSVLLVFSTFSGCTSKSDKQQPKEQEKSTAQEASTAQDQALTSLPLPITNTPITLKYWCELSEDVATSYTNLGDTPLYKQIEKRTGIKVVFLHPPVGVNEANEQFNLMIASKDLPDIIEHNWLNYPGGPEKAMADGIIVPMNDLIDRYAPELKNIYNGSADENKLVSKMAKTDEGKYYAVPMIYLDDAQLVWHGPLLRKDWMDDLKLEVPTTIDEWYSVLKVFKAQKNASAPFSFMNTNLTISNAFIGAFGIGREFYLDGNTAKFGPAEPAYKDWLAAFAKWYAEGLLDPDFATQDRKTFDSKIMGDKAGGFLGNQGGHMGKYLTAMKDKNPNFKLMGVPYPSLKKGEVPNFGQKDFPIDSNAGAAITTANKFQKESMMYLDYGFTEEGHMLFNFGIEGESYTMVNGYPKYTDFVTKNPKGLTFGQAATQYSRAIYNGPFVCDPRYFEQYMQYPEQLQAVNEWRKAGDKARYPPATPTPDESQKLATLMNEINTYVDEMTLKFIMGQESIDKFDEYLSKIKGMGIDEAVKIKQTALERFNKR